MHITLPEKVEFIINNLIAHGYEAYGVGGCVRDTYLGKAPKDWDITTSAKPETVKELFQRTIDTGIQHGTVTVMLDKEGFEVTTYRIDGEYEDSRHPRNVEFTCNLKEDLKRRDFTINAMAYNSKEGLVDIFDGIGDIQRKLIRCVGNPLERFEEDALRMLRAIRFAGQLGFSIDGATREAIIEKAPTLKNISAERIRVEVDKLLRSKQPELLKEASKTGMCKVFLPEFDRMLQQEQNNPYHIFSVGNHVLKAVWELNQYWEEQGLEDEKHHSILCWTMLLHDVAKPFCHTVDKEGIDHFYGHGEAGAAQAKNILRRLKFDNASIDLTVRLIKWHDYRFTPKAIKVRKAASKIGPDIMEDLFLVQRIDILAKNPERKKEKTEQLNEIMEIYKDILKKQQCLTLKELAINGKDLIEEAGIPSGPKIGETLTFLLNYVLEYPEKNQREILLDKIRK
ncbi:MAG: CCA tRNA nucleotidyltransferase [Acetivibrio sp.]